MLMDMAKSPGSQLRVEERVTDEVRRTAGGIRTAASGTSDYETIIVGRLHGPAFVVGRYAPKRAATKLRETVAHAFGMAQEDAGEELVRLGVIEDAGPQALIDCWARVSSVFSKLPEAWAEVRAAWDFLSLENVKGIDGWGKRLGARRVAEAIITSTAVVLVYRQGGETERVTLTRPSVQRPQDS